MFKKKYKYLDILGKRTTNLFNAHTIFFSNLSKKLSNCNLLPDCRYLLYTEQIYHGRVGHLRNLGIKKFPKFDYNYTEYLFSSDQLVHVFGWYGSLLVLCVKNIIVKMWCFHYFYAHFRVFILQLASSQMSSLLAFSTKFVELFDRYTIWTTPVLSYVILGN